MSGLASMRPVRAVGICMHPYQFPSETPYVTLGLTALRAARPSRSRPRHGC